MAGLPLPISRADLGPPKRVGVRVRARVRVRSGVGLVWAPQTSLCADLHIGNRHTQIAMNLRANPNSLARRCNFMGAGISIVQIQPRKRM